ncbi:family 65 glycosyl hydrolase domain-containing protein [Sphingobacterium sp. UDSM-2020]|uniref:family 65 glycosyl hydrolase domain-containing protein n=1 Tax=Sphingobacterium sp. UDSM-2020 TaxID=2795738 RepID=UPI0019350F5F|nr:family 65 glycosyl hydrolase domain-containing protein [Sphingobacterium sp. UDSM-2020]QQD11706.1 glycoside hydrolase family 65 protein [Sphingobacterium sp. UDSM-2020]
MKNYIVHDEWNIIEEGFQPAYNEISESIFSIGNGRMGQRANFEEDYSGKSLSGSYLAGVYYPDKTRVGWWKNGYPEYFAKVINAINWIGLHIEVNGEVLDLAKCDVHSFQRKLDMKHGLLIRSFDARLQNGMEIRVKSTRIFHLFQSETASLKYTIQVLNQKASLQVESYLEGDVVNRDSNYDEHFWNFISSGTSDSQLNVTMKTKKTDFIVRADLFNNFTLNNKTLESKPSKEGAYVSESVAISVEPGDIFSVEKRVSMVTSQNYSETELVVTGKANIEKISAITFDELQHNQALAWGNFWNESDIQITADVAAQQAIRFNIFQLYQTYTGEDSRLNIGPKGFTGEKYGGVTYWDTEAYCVPFYLATQPSAIARNLLLYRYQHLDKAIENAAKLGFSKGAALYPMVTMNGEECHNEWEITFEEIHRNGAIAFAIYNYQRYTGDWSYVENYGLEVLIAISRFWAQRVNWSAEKDKYVILGVTGPNEYENNVNNNWYTNTIASWCLKYTLESIQTLKDSDHIKLKVLFEKVAFKQEEAVAWQHIMDHLYYPIDTESGIFLQQDGYLDKEQVLVADLPDTERPINQKWSWDRILRSCFIKQADVLQGLYFFEDQYDLDTIRKNYDFYEPRTVHESSLSPCVHAILASKLGNEAKAYEFYLRTARLDLDDYNNDTEDGLHITSMAGTWMSIVEGFAGMRVKNNTLIFQTFIPKTWESYAFHVQFRGVKLFVKIKQHDFELINKSNQEINIIFNGEEISVKPSA